MTTYVFFRAGLNYGEVVHRSRISGEWSKREEKKLRSQKGTDVNEVFVRSTLDLCPQWSNTIGYKIGSSPAKVYIVARLLRWRTSSMG